MLRIAVPLVALVAVIFAVTFFSQYGLNDDPAGVGKDVGKDPPLRFFSATRKWDPPSFLPPSREQPFDYRGMPLMAPSAMPPDPDDPFRFSLSDRVFPGFYEPQPSGAGRKNTASFWFENPHTRPVSMQLKAVSCLQCSGAGVASIPPDVTRQILQMSRVAVLPQGLFSGLPLGMVGPTANLDEQFLTWQKFDFQSHPDATLKVQPAGENTDGYTPQWGILRLDFSITAEVPKDLRAEFHSIVEGTQITNSDKFEIRCLGVKSFDLTRASIDLGEISEKSEPRRFEIIAFSSTRGKARSGPGDMGDLMAPTVSIRNPQSPDDPGEFVTISPPERVPDFELGLISERITQESQRQRFARVEGAYRYTVTVSPRLGAKSIDIGLMERDITFSLPGEGQVRTLNVKGLVSGVVWLDNNQSAIILDNVPQSRGSVRTLRVITARPELDVRLLDKQWKPEFLDVKFEKDPKPAAGDRGYYILTVKVPSSKESTRIRPGTFNGEVILEVQGQGVQKIRIPVQGRIELN